MTDISNLKNQSDIIATYDDRLREISNIIRSLEVEKETITNKKAHAVWQLQDSIDLLSKS
jgi:hypothetical protein